MKAGSSAITVALTLIANTFSEMETILARSFHIWRSTVSGVAPDRGLPRRDMHKSNLLEVQRRVVCIADHFTRSILLLLRSHTTQIMLTCQRCRDCGESLHDASVQVEAEVETLVPYTPLQPPVPCNAAQGKWSSQL
jgi:hypothetical protein